MSPTQLFSKVPLINSAPHSARISMRLSPAAGVRVLQYILLIAIAILIEAGGAYAKEGDLTDDQARQQCFKGKTIYCIALGIKEENSGHRDRALELYRIACRKHPTPGHLRACTPLLSLAGKMNILNEEAAPLEARCGAGDHITCFYLGKEYLKLAELEGAARYLEPLCRSRFRSPTADDHGPCYHLAKGYGQAGQWNRARELFRFDCENDPGHAQPSCRALNEVMEMEKVHRELGQKGISGSDPVEAVLFLIVLMSFLNVLVWFKGGRRGLKYLSLAAPALVWGSVLIWVYWPEKPEFPASQWAVIYFALLQVSGMAVFALRKLQDTRVSR